MAASAIMFDDNLIDVCVLIAERNKVREWADDFAEFTGLTVARYEGTKAKRLRLLLPENRPQVLIATYETARADMVVKDQADRRKMTPGEFTTALHGLRVFIVWDEMSKLGNRDSQLHKAHHLAVQYWRANGECRTMGLTATPMERNPENYYNLGRILTPGTVGSVRQFHAQHVTDYDMFGNASKFTNLPALAHKMAPVLLRKRKTDPDVRDQFPRMMERFTFVELGDDHQRFYDEVEESIEMSDDPIAQQVGFTVLRLLAGHPMSLVDSQGEMAKALVESVGIQRLTSMGSAKTESLIAYLDEVVNESQAVVFTYYVSVLRLLERAIRDAGLTVATYHGQMPPADRESAKARFRAGEVQVLLASSAAEKGINLPEAGYVVNYDLPTKHTSYVQRLNRISRIGTVNSEVVTAQSFIARNTVEESIAGLWLGRNQQSDILLDPDAGDDEEFVSADTRRALLRSSRSTPKEQ